MSRARSGRSPPERGSGTTALAAAPRERDPRSARPLPAMEASSPQACRLLLLDWLEIRQLQPPEEDDLPLEDDSELLARTASGLPHERETVGTRRLAGVLDE